MNLSYTGFRTFGQDCKSIDARLESIDWHGVTEQEVMPVLCWLTVKPSRMKVNILTCAVHPVAIDAFIDLEPDTTETSGQRPRADIAEIGHQDAVDFFNTLPVKGSKTSKHLVDAVACKKLCCTKLG